MSAVAFLLWLIVAVIGFAVWLVFRVLRRRRGVGPSPGPSGIRGWFALLALGVFVGVPGNIYLLVKTAAVISDGWARSPAAHVPLTLAFAVGATVIPVNIWAAITLIQKKKIFRMAFLALWVATTATVAGVLLLLMVPGMTMQAILPPAAIRENIVAFAGMGIWYWYLRVSVRVRNTLIN